MAHIARSDFTITFADAVKPAVGQSNHNVYTPIESSTHSWSIRQDAKTLVLSKEQHAQLAKLLYGRKPYVHCTWAFAC